MPRHLHETANAVLYRALDLPAGDRQQFIAQATAGDTELLDDVRTMLSRIEQLDQFLEDPLELPSEPVPVRASLPVRGEPIGRWRVEHELGRNGADLILQVREEAAGGAAVMGTMRLAQAASRTGQTSARFERLRERLATLDHPAIPTPVDSGTTPDGRPYFVVSRGAGLSIDAYCARHALDLPARAALFARVCLAVHYMHQHLIVHRDLKPSDMLIDGDRLSDGAPAITLLDSGMIGEGWALNAAYASPDQLAGQPLSVASDIYSLGAVLYALVTGQLPHGSDSVLRTHQREAVVPASQAVRTALAQGRGATEELAADPMLAPSSALADALQAHFDAVLDKALAADPVARYASAHALAHDLMATVDAWNGPAPTAPGVRFDTVDHGGGEPAAEIANAEAPAAPAAIVAPPRRSSVGLAVLMLVAGLAAGGAGALFGLPYLQQAGVLPPASPVAAVTAVRAAPKALALDTAIDPATARDLTIAPLAQRGELALQGAAWQAALSDSRRAAGDLDGAASAASQAMALVALAPPEEQVLARAAAQQRLGATLAAQGHTAEGLAALRTALAVQQARAGKGAGEAADISVAIAEALAGSGDQAGAEAALNQARSWYATVIDQAQADGNGALVKRQQARLLEAELARASAQNSQKHGRDTVATLSGLRRLAGAEGNPHIDLLEAYVQPRGTPAQAYAAAQPAFEKIRASSKGMDDAGQMRQTALAALMTGEIGLRAQQKAPACAQLLEAQSLFDGLAAAHHDNAYDTPLRARVARARAACG